MKKLFFANLFFILIPCFSGQEFLPYSSDLIKFDDQKWESIPVKYLLKKSGPIKVSLRNKAQKDNMRLFSSSLIFNEKKLLKNPCEKKAKSLKKKNFKVTKIKIENWDCNLFYTTKGKSFFFSGRHKKIKIGDKERYIVQFFEENNSYHKISQVRNWLKNVN